MLHRNGLLDCNYAKRKIEALVFKVIKETEESFFEKEGKNFYISNTIYNIRVTVNSYTFRVITVDRLSKLKKN